MRRFDWLYLIAALPFFFLALAGAEYGAFWLYLAPAIFCFVQFLLPTRFGWGLITLLYGASAVVYTGSLLTDVWRFVRGEPLNVLLDADDSAFFIVIVAFLCLLTVLLLRRRSHRPAAGGESIGSDSNA